jgi:CheY-like chemotaxis protein
VLVVEDEQDARDVVTLLLEGSGADVQTATSVTEALAHIDACMPDLCFECAANYCIIRELRCCRGRIPPSPPTSILSKSV